ncbi:hypothetical protein [Microbacterium jejuense]|uniref:hypothetical protein n=1 Tax=Microbacterium jejuense TaxID=1263637 RepID=UPI0031F08FDD
MERTTLLFNILAMGILAVVLIVMLFVMTGNAAAYRRADALSRGLRLPYGTAATRDVIAARGRRSMVWTLAGAVVGLCFTVPFLATPLGDEMYFLIAAGIPLIVVPAVTVQVVINLRERLFRPAPDVPRVARLTRMHVRDYLGRARLRAPWMFAAILAAVAVAVVASRWIAPASVDDTALVAFAVVTVIAGALQAARPMLARLVLDQPQPAADTLELAWDDALRTGTLSSLSLASCQLSGVAIGLGTIALVGPGSLWAAMAMQLPTWGILVPQFIYQGWNGQLPLQPALYPDWLRRPAAVGAEGSPA